MAIRKITVLAFGAETAEVCRKEGRLGTARNYEKTIRSFGTFVKTSCSLLRNGDGGVKDLSFGQLTEECLLEYEHWLSAKGVVRNSSSFYMRNLRSIFNKAVEAGAAAEGNPFRKVYTGIDRTRKRAVGEELIMRLQRMDLTRSASLEMTRDLFIFSYCARGMSFVDIAFLRKTDVVDGVISYIRRKTGQRLAVRLEPCISRIISKYELLNGDSPYVFPIVTSSDPETSYMQYRIALNYHNRKLKRLALILGEKLSLSTYTARHTWATAARNRNVPVSVISAGMGHASEKTTQIYLAALDDSVIDQANRGIVGELNSVGSA